MNQIIKEKGRIGLYIILLKARGGMTAYNDKCDYVSNLSDEFLEQYIKNYEAQQKQIAKAKDFIARNKARAATAGMAASRQKMLDKMDDNEDIQEVFCLANNYLDPEGVFVFDVNTIYKYQEIYPLS